MTLGRRHNPAGLTTGGFDCPTTGTITVSTIPSDGRYYLTSFGGGSDTQGVACHGMPSADGTWYYLADKDRFGCGTKVRITNPANQRAVVAQVIDVGPNVCVEQAGGMPVIDASPLVSQYLFDSGSSGWADRRVVLADVVDPSTPLGPSTPLEASMGSFGWLLVLGGVAWVTNELWGTR